MDPLRRTRPCPGGLTATGGRRPRGLRGAVVEIDGFKVLLDHRQAPERGGAFWPGGSLAGRGMLADRGHNGGTSRELPTKVGEHVPGHRRSVIGRSAGRSGWGVRTGALWLLDSPVSKQAGGLSGGLIGRAARRPGAGGLGTSGSAPNPEPHVLGPSLSARIVGTPIRAILDRCAPWAGPGPLVIEARSARGAGAGP